MNYMTPGWRERFCLTGASLMHEAASKQARLAVIAFRDSNLSKHDRRIRLKKRLKAGKIKKYRRNRWTDPSSLLRGGKTPALLHSLASRGTPKMRDPSTVFLPGLGNVQLKEGIPKGEPRSFQMVDCTGKVTCTTTDADRRFALHVQLEIPDPRPATGNQAGMDLGVRRLAAIADECGNETLHNVAGGCRRRDGDKVDRMKSEQAGHKKGSRAWRKTGRQIRKKLRKDIQPPTPRRDQGGKAGGIRQIHDLHGGMGLDESQGCRRECQVRPEPRNGILQDGGVS